MPSCLDVDDHAVTIIIHCLPHMTTLSSGPSSEQQLGLPIPSGDNRETPTYLQKHRDNKKRGETNKQITEHYRNQHEIIVAIIQLKNGTPWMRLAPCQSIDNIARDDRNHFIPPTCTNSPREWHGYRIPWGKFVGLVGVGVRVGELIPQ